MAFDGSGNFNRTNTWTAHRDAGFKIRADYHDTHDQDLANGLTGCITKTGQTQPTADIPLNGHKLVNVGYPDDPTDAATRAYVDAVKAFGTGIVITGADANGRIRFDGTGANGLEFKSADLSWLARPAEASKTSNRLVMNDTISPGTGTDRFIIGDDGSVNTSTGNYTNNGSWDGAAWRTIAPGRMGLLNIGQGNLTFSTNRTATDTDPYKTATLTNPFSVTAASVGSTIMTLNKKKPTATDANQVAIYGTVDGLMRWNMQLGNAGNETGSSAGSEFVLTSYNDAGAAIGTAQHIDRSTRDVTFYANVIGGTGYRCRNGTGGGYGANNFNILYSGGYNYLLIDATNMGYFALTCDYRIKKDIQPLPSMWDRVKSLNPISYTHRAFDIIPEDDIVRWGFIAHEMQEKLIDSAASFHKDEEKVIQGPNMLAIVAALTKALQEAMTRIEALEAAP